VNLPNGEIAYTNFDITDKLSSRSDLFFNILSKNIRPFRGFELVRDLVWIDFWLYL
jgi:hypothetical protein